MTDANVTLLYGRVDVTTSAQEHYISTVELNTTIDIITTSHSDDSTQHLNIGDITTLAQNISTLYRPDQYDKPLWLLSILIFAVFSNFMVISVIRLDRMLHHLTYYFFISLAVLHILMAIIAMPPAILVALAGKLFEF